MSNDTEIDDLTQIRDRQRELGSDIDAIIDRVESHGEADALWNIRQRANAVADDIDQILKRREDEPQPKTRREATEAENGPGEFF